MSLTDNKAIRAIAFSGKQEEWSVWEAKFLAKANRKGFKKVLLGKKIAPTRARFVKNSRLVPGVSGPLQYWTVTFYFILVE